MPSTHDANIPWKIERSAEERKLLALARRWCDRHAPEALWPLEGWIIAQQLYDAGALALPLDAEWPDWPEIEGVSKKVKAAAPAPRVGELEARERLRATVPVYSPTEVERKPVGMAEAIREVKKAIGEVENG